MRILLTTLNSKYVHSNLALKYLYGVSMGSGLDISLQEFTINNEWDYVYGEIVRGGYDLICFSCYIWNIEEIKTLAREIKKACPNTKILLGGPEVSYETESLMLQNPWIDFVIRGEGETAFFEFCKYLVLKGEEADLSEDAPQFQGIKSLSRRLNGEIISNESASAVNLNNIPFPYQYLELEKDKVIYYETVRGCPYRCSYCLSSLDKGMRTLDKSNVERQLRYFLTNHVKQVKFLDRTFNFSEKRAYDIWKFIIDNDNGITNFHFEICGELLTDEQINLLRRARKGLLQFEIGVQTTNPITLKAIGRSTDIDRLMSNIQKLQALGNIHIHLDLIAGLPHESYHSFARSFNRVFAARPDMLQLGFLKLLKGTKIYEERSKHGYIWRDSAPYEVISNIYISSGEIVRLKMIEKVLDLYYNRGGFCESLEYLEASLSSSSFDFYETLADFFYKNGFQKRSHRKEDVYRILYRFVCENSDKISINDAKELIEKDLIKTMNEDAVKKFMKKGWELIND
ncbi:MAG: DUF4080 domain-containing protein [Eubacterium sp.]|nr:DUF4080 domain-containing protein [Eubacterium sp.]